VLSSTFIIAVSKILWPYFDWEVERGVHAASTLPDQLTLKRVKPASTPDCRID